MKAHLISTENNKIVVKQCSSSATARGFKADLVVLLSNYEGTQVEKKEVEEYKQCIDTSKLKGKLEDHVVTYARLLSDKLLSLGIYPNTSDFRLC
jgi:hypothetical protein